MCVKVHATTYITLLHKYYIRRTKETTVYTYTPFHINKFTYIPYKFTYIPYKYTYIQTNKHA